MCIQKRTHKSYAVHLKFPWKWRENNNNNDDEQIIYYVNNNKKLRIKFGKYLENHCVCVCKRWRGLHTHRTDLNFSCSWVGCCSKRISFTTSRFFYIMFAVCGAVRCGAVRCGAKINRSMWNMHSCVCINLFQ